MKVLHILDHSIPYVDGYSIRSRHIIDKQKEAGLHPKVLTSPLHRGVWNSSPEEFNGVEYHRIGMQGVSNLRFLREIQIIKRIRKKAEALYRKDGFDIIHAHSPSLNGVAAMMVSRKVGVPYVYESRALWEDAALDQNKFTKNSLKYKISRKVETLVFKNASAVTAIAQYLIREIESRGISAKKIHHIPNGVDTTAFMPAPKKDELLQRYGIDTQQSLVLGFIGSFYKFEGIDVLLDTMHLLKQRHPKVRLMLIGGGEEMEHIKRRVSEESLDNVILTGRVPFEEVNDYYAAMDIMIYPRLSERITELTTPLKPLEAMAMERAVIGSDVGGIKELIQDGANGILFRASDSVDLERKIISLLDADRRVSLGIEARRYVVREKEWRRIVRRYFSIYRAALGSAPR